MLRHGALIFFATTALSGCAIQAAGHLGSGESFEPRGGFSLSSYALKGRARGPLLGARVSISDRGTIQNGALLVGVLQRPLNPFGFGYEGYVAAGLGEPLFQDLQGTALLVGLGGSGFFRLVGPTRRRAIHVASASLDLVLGVEGSAWIPERNPASPGCLGCPIYELTGHAGLRLSLLSELITEGPQAEPREEDEAQ